MLWSARVRAEGRREGRRARGLRGARQEAHAIFRHLPGGWVATDAVLPYGTPTMCGLCEPTGDHHLVVATVVGRYMYIKL